MSYDFFRSRGERRKEKSKKKKKIPFVNAPVHNDVSQLEEEEKDKRKRGESRKRHLIFTILTSSMLEKLLTKMFTFTRVADSEKEKQKHHSSCSTCG